MQEYKIHLYMPRFLHSSSAKVFQLPNQGNNPANLCFLFLLQDKLLLQDMACLFSSLLYKKEFFQPVSRQPGQKLSQANFQVNQTIPPLPCIFHDFSISTEDKIFHSTIHLLCFYSLFSLIFLPLSFFPLILKLYTKE